MSSKRGRLIRSTGSSYIVEDEEGNLIECRLRGNFRIKGIKTTNPLAVGDYVIYTPGKPDECAQITKIEERRNYIIRKATKQSKLFHIIAANVDRAILVVTLAMPRTSTGFIDRFLVTAEAYRIPATLVFNKLDIYTDEIMLEYERISDIYSKIGYECMGVSALRGDNIESFVNHIKDKTSLISGHSGVGKSALLNRVEPSLKIKTAPISIAHKKGTHTTTFAEMHPLSFGGYVIDTPGIKEFGIIDFYRDELTHYFPEMFKILPQCRFYNCTHYHEPDCTVKREVGKGNISEERYQNYIGILLGEELEFKPGENN